MKHISFIILTSCLFFQYGYAQKLKDSLRNLNDYDLGNYYLKQSKQQKTFGFVLLGGGITLTIIGGNKIANDIFSKSTGGEALMLIGTLASVASIPVFLSASKNKGKAKILLRNQNIPLTNISGTRLLSVGLAIPVRN